MVHPSLESRDVYFAQCKENRIDKDLNETYFSNIFIERWVFFYAKTFIYLGLLQFIG